MESGRRSSGGALHLVRTLARKISSARAIFRSEGARGLLRAVRYQQPLGRMADHSLVRLIRIGFWRNYDNPVLGRVVELRGNEARLDGCRFTLDCPAISTGLKALFLFGRYERAERLALRRYLDPADPVVELGGSIGVLACITNRRLSDPSRHVVVEPNPELLDVLARNRARNGCAFTILHRAIAYGAPVVPFDPGRDFLHGVVRPASGAPARATPGTPRAEARGTALVTSISLREILRGFAFERCTLLCDIEGGEVDLVRHELETLRERVGTFVVELHERSVGAAAVRAMLNALAGAGFVTVASSGQVLVLRGTVARSPRRPPPANAFAG